MGLAQRQLANEPSGSNRLASSAEHKAKAAVGAAEGWRRLGPGWHCMPLESAGMMRIGSVPFHRCPCHQGNCCQRHRDPRVAPQPPAPSPLAVSLSNCPPIPAVGRRSPSPCSPTRAEQDEELQHPVRGAKGPVPADHHLRLEEPNRARKQCCPPCPPMPLSPDWLSWALLCSA